MGNNTVTKCLCEVWPRSVAYWQSLRFSKIW